MTVSICLQSHSCPKAPVNHVESGPAEAIWVWYGKMGYVHCQRQCVEACSADVYIARSAEIFFHGNFSVAWMGSRSTFLLCTALPLLSVPCNP